jgi:hypothetical protein
LERIEEYTFHGSGLRSILIPSSVVVLGGLSLRWCNILEFVRFENGSRLERIEESAFHESRLKSIDIPGSATFIDGSAFAGISLNPDAVFPDNMRFCHGDEFLEDFDGSFRSIVIPSSVVVWGNIEFL